MFIATFAIRFRVAIVVLAVALVPLALLGSVDVMSMLKPGGFFDEDAESTKARDAVRRFGAAADLIVLYTARDPGVTVDDVTAFATIVPALSRIERDPSVQSVVSFYDTSAPHLVSADRKSTFVALSLHGTDPEKVEAAHRLRPLLQAEGFTVTLGGYAPVFEGITDSVERDLRRAELLAFPITGLLLLLIFRSVVSAAIPVVLGGVAVLFALAILRILAAFTDVTVFAANIATILGLGLAIDYSLFVLNRYREELPKVGEHRAVLRAMTTTGRAVVFSGITVAVSLLGLFAFPHGMLRSIAVGGIAVTLMTVGLAVTLLPAMLSLLGKRIDAWRLPFGFSTRIRDDEDDPWHKLAHAVMARPVAVVAIVTVVLLGLAAPFLRFEGSIADSRTLPRASEARQVAEAIDGAFTPHQSTAHDVIVGFDGPVDPTALYRLVEAARDVPGITRVDSAFGPAPTLEQGLELYRRVQGEKTLKLFVDDDTARLSLVSAYDANAKEALAQVAALRALPPPPGGFIAVGGQSAWVQDVRDSLRACTPRMVFIIALAMFVVLFLVFGSVVLPLKAMVLNMLSLTASFGAIVYIFQEGRLQDLLQFEGIGVTEASVPVLMFAVVFGLSMDYEVLLLSRVREEYLRTGDNARAVAFGLQRTGRLITSAALLLVVVIAAFGTSELLPIKTLATGMAIAIALDATVVRCLLVPAAMILMGRVNWWAPAPLRKLWERFAISE